MKKTVTINLNGVIFHIDEDAHEMLNKYLEKIKGYFSDSQGKDEIMADIEARIAEMFQEKITGSKEVIAIADVEAVISVMGKPEDYVDAESAPGSQTTAESEPSSDYTEYRRRRVFRDPDNNVFGGVCGGISAYFNFDPIWMRVAFAISFFVFGTGFLLYLLLWIIIPMAKTTADRLEMKGESVNISNIEKSIKEELDNLKKKFDDLKNGSGSTATKQHRQKAKNVFDKIIDFIVSLLTFAVQTIAKFIGVIFIALGIVFIISLLSTLFGTGGILSITPAGISTIALSDFTDLFFVAEDQLTQVTIGLLLLLGIPFIAIIYNGIKMLLGIKKRIRGLGIVAMSLWIAGCILLGYVGLQVGSDFSKKGISKSSLAIERPADNTLYLEVIGEEYYEDEYESKMNFGDWHCYYVEDEEISFGNAKLDIVKSKTDSIEIQMIYSARGKTRKKASKRAGNIQYMFTQKDSLIQFDPYFKIPDGEKWRNQKVKILIKLPDSASVFLSNSMDRIIFDVENVTGTYDHHMVGKKWTMLPDGLTCIGCDEEDL